VIEAPRGDAFRVSEERTVVLDQAEAAEILLFDLPYWFPGAL
jgi:hypothetical protein